MNDADLEITRLCAKAMGLNFLTVKSGAYMERPEKELDYVHDGVYLFNEGSNMWSTYYCPIHDDAAAMALVKKFSLDLHCRADRNGWYVGDSGIAGSVVTHADLNQAICRWVAQQFAAKE